MEISSEVFVFQTDSDIVQQGYRNNPNYLVEYSDNCPMKEYCAIYFSSNDIYYPNTEPFFRKKIIERNGYEWYGTRINIAYKHIFIRDIFKQWYLAGINTEINTPEKLLDMLKKETEGYKVITLGSSAGGYAAALYGSQLGADRILTFSPQFTLSGLLARSSEKIDPLIFRLHNKPVAQYFDIYNFINTHTDIFYFFPKKSAWDIEQYEYVYNLQNVKTICINTAHHGIPFPKACLPEIINLDKDALNRLSGKTYNFYWFSVRQVGLIATVSGIINQLYKVYKKRMNL